MRLLRRKQQREILDNLLRVHSGIEQDSLFGNDDEERKRYIETFNAITEIADVVTGSDIGMFTEFARKIVRQMR